MKISVEPAQLQNKSEEILQLKDELEDRMDQIETLVLSVNGAWQGDAEKAFASRIVYVKKQLLGITAFFEDYAQLLKNFSIDYEEYDTELCSKMNLV